jgi:hypothetical protein
MARKIPIPEERFAEDLVNIAPVADRVRLVALDQTGVLTVAKAQRLQRQVALKTARLGKDAPEVLALQERLRVQRVLSTQVRAETQRAETVPPERLPDRFILHGRVVDRNRIGQNGLTVSAVDQQGRPRVFTCTDERGYFKLDIAIASDNSGTREPLFLQVSDPRQVLLFRGDEAHVPAPQLVIYREIVLGDVRPEPCPPPPQPAAEPKTVPNVVGMNAAEAASALQASGLHVGQVRQVPNDRVGIVLDQEPKASTPVPEGTAVDLVVGGRRPTIRDEIITRIGRDPQFGQLGVSGQELGNRFQALGIESIEQVAVLLDRPNPELREALRLSSIRRVQLFKRMLRQVLENLEG